MLKKKKIYSVHKFCKDNDVSFEFDSSNVKDRGMQEVLIKGVSDGLYTLTKQPSGPSIQSPPHYEFICERASLNKWHSRLEHVNENTTRKICNKFQLPIVTNCHFLLLIIHLLNL